MADRLLLVRHGETEWARERRHTGRTDVPLDDAGRAQAAALAGRLPLAELAPIGAVWSSPLSRAVDTAALAGLAVDRTDDDLLEWDYGPVEGLTTADLRLEHPDWDVWDGGPQAIGDGGETVDEVGARVDRVLARAAAVDGTVVLVAHAHVLRILAVRWLGLPPRTGRHLALDPAGWAVLAHERETPVIERWNPPAPDTSP